MATAFDAAFGLAAAVFAVALEFAGLAAAAGFLSAALAAAGLVFAPADDLEGDFGGDFAEAPLAALTGIAAAASDNSTFLEPVFEAGAGFAPKADFAADLAAGLATLFTGGGALAAAVLVAVFAFAPFAPEADLAAALFTGAGALATAVFVGVFAFAAFAAGAFAAAGFAAGAFAAVLPVLAFFSDLANLSSLVKGFQPARLALRLKTKILVARIIPDRSGV